MIVVSLKIILIGHLEQLHWRQVVSRMENVYSYRIIA
jgi:hypothetical protein